MNSPLSSVATVREQCVSLETAVAISELSRRTWWRRLAGGQFERHRDGSRGRTMLSLEKINASICIAMSPEDLEILQKADEGVASAQNDMGLLFATHQKNNVALFWFRQAASQDHADAMQHLARHYFSGLGVEKDENLGFMWLAKAAAHGSVIAAAQMKWLRGHWPEQLKANPAALFDFSG